MATRTSISWPIAIGLVLVVLGAFAPTLTNDFVNWDDDLVLTDNQSYRGLSPAHLRWMATTMRAGHYQPLTWLSYGVDHALWGMDPRGYHLTNLALHALNAVLVWLVLRTLLCGLASNRVVMLAAAAGALFFAVHPLRVESVAWATERRDVLSGCFWLLALFAYLRAVARGTGLGLALAALTLSLGAKAWGMTFPLVLLILDAYPLGRLRRDWRGAVREKLPFLALATLAAVLAFRAQHALPEMRTLADHGLGARLAQAGYGLSFYLGKTVLPVGLHPAYLLEPGLDPTDVRYLAALAMVAAITAAALLLRRRAPYFLTTWAAYVVIVAPVLGLAQTGPQLVADRYTYLAMLPWTVLLTAGVALLASRAPAARRAMVGTTAAVVALLAVITFQQTRIWHDSLTLWDHVLAIDPGNWVAYTNRGFARHGSDAAIADYSAAIRLNPRYDLAYFNRGNARHERGDLAGAVSDHSAVIALLPNDPKAYTNRGWAKQALGDWVGAAHDYERALELGGPDWWARDQVLGNLATARARITVNDR